MQASSACPTGPRRCKLRNFASLFTRRLAATSPVTSSAFPLVSNDPAASGEGNVRPAFPARFSLDHKGFAASIEVTS